MKNLASIGLTSLGTVCGVALSLPATAANLTSNDYCSTNSGCTEVFTELALILDGSDSITNAEFQQQLNIYKNVFGSSKFYTEILDPLSTKKIAVSVFQLGYKDGQRVKQNIGWTLIESQTDANNFASLFTSIEKMGDSDPDTITGNKSPIGDSITAAHSSLRSNNFAGDYLIMDIGSDGYIHSETQDWDLATKNAYNDGINAINGISIDPTKRPGFIPQGTTPILDNIVSLTDIDDTSLISNNPNATWKNPSGTEGFLIVTENLDNYQQLLSNKIAQEILPNFDPDKDYLDPDENKPVETVPEPSLLWGLLSISLLGVVTRSKS